LSTAPELNLELWAERHRLPFCHMHEDTQVMADLGGPMEAAQSHEKFNRYANAWAEHGISRWALEDNAGNFIGYCGVMFRPDIAHPLGPHYEIGWRLYRDAWGKGFAYRSAILALKHAWTSIGPLEILSYTAPDNVRSQKVMSRSGLKRCPTRDFYATYDGFPEPWHGLVWSSQKP
jgi:RimJ/RimL family protein N-acetyltransferase